MRIDPDIVQFLRQAFREKVPGSAIYLFGSRARDDAAGGDIDLMILSDRPVERNILRDIRIDFYKKFGWQKIDFVNFTYEDQSTFRQIIEPDAIAL